MHLIFDFSLKIKYVFCQQFCTQCMIIIDVIDNKYDRHLLLFSCKQVLLLQLDGVMIEYFFIEIELNQLILFVSIVSKPHRHMGREIKK